jgi:hypothetical protein
MIPQIIVVFCISYLSFTLLFVVFHPSRCFSISFEILNEAKMIHHYVNDYDHLLFVCFNCLFECKSLKLGLPVIKVSTIHFMGHLFSSLGNGYGV